MQAHVSYTSWQTKVAHHTTMFDDGKCFLQSILKDDQFLLCPMSIHRTIGFFFSCIENDKRLFLSVNWCAHVFCVCEYFQHFWIWKYVFFIHFKFDLLFGTIISVIWWFGTVCCIFSPFIYWYIVLFEQLRGMNSSPVSAEQQHSIDFDFSFHFFVKHFKSMTVVSRCYLVHLFLVFCVDLQIFRHFFPFISLSFGIRNTL